MASETLERRGHVGLVLESSGLVVKSVVPGSSAHAAGARPGDRLVHIDHNAAHDLNEVRLLLRGLRAGAPLLLGVERGGQPAVLESEVMPFPLEEHVGARVVLDAVRVRGHLLRVYAVVPEAKGPHPVLQYLPGAHWASEEYPRTPEHPVPGLADAAVRAGYAFVRVERSGLGDSQGPPCTRVDFEGELAAHLAGLSFFENAAWADEDRVVLFGHSLGAMVAPLLAQQRPVAGIVTFGASMIPISEALVAAIVRHAERQTDPNAPAWAAQISELIRLVVQGGHTPAEVFDERPDLARIAPKHFAGDQAYHRVVSFYHQLETRDLWGAWRAWQGPTLVLHGALDFISSQEDSRTLADTLGPRALRLELPGVDHQMSGAASGAPPRRADAVENALVSWLEGLS